MRERVSMFDYVEFGLGLLRLLLVFIFSLLALPLTLSIFLDSFSHSALAPSPGSMVVNILGK